MGIKKKLANLLILTMMFELLFSSPGISSLCLFDFGFGINAEASQENKASNSEIIPDQGKPNDGQGKNDQEESDKKETGDNAKDKGKDKETDKDKKYCISNRFFIPNYKTEEPAGREAGGGRRG